MGSEKVRSPESFRFRHGFWCVIKDLERGDRPTSPGQEGHKARMVMAVARAFQRLAKKDHDRLVAYARFMGVSRAELVRWLTICRKRLKEAREYRESADSDWQERSKERCLREKEWEKLLKRNDASRKMPLARLRGRRSS